MTDLSQSCGYCEAHSKQYEDRIRDLERKLGVARNALRDAEHTITDVIERDVDWDWMRGSQAMCRGALAEIGEGE